MVFGVEAGFSISQAADLVIFLKTHQSSKFTQNGAKNGRGKIQQVVLGGIHPVDQGRMDTLYNHSEKKCITGHTLRIWRQICYNKRKHHQVLNLSAKNSSLRLQWAQSHRNWNLPAWVEKAGSSVLMNLDVYSDMKIVNSMNPLAQSALCEGLLLTTCIPL